MHIPWSTTGTWQRELPNTALPWGMFGENFTTEGLIEGAVNIGDRFRIGSAEVVATQPRMPCYKLRSQVWTDGCNSTILGQRSSWNLL